MIQLTRICICAIVLYLTAIKGADAVTIAVFPFEDLSQGRNGVNQEMTDCLSGILAGKGLDVISGPDVISFLAMNRIRWLGYMYSNHILDARNYLGVDLILLGTVCQYKEKGNTALGLTVSLIRTEDAVTIWSNSVSISQANIRHLLGVGEPDSVGKLLPYVVKEIMSGWPERLGQTLPPEQAEVEVDSWSLTSKHVRPGEEMGAEVRFSIHTESDELPRVFFKEGNRLHIAFKSPDSDTYEAKWFSPYTEGVYPISLLLRWPSGEGKTSFLEDYYVDGSPPDMDLNIRGLASREKMMRDQVVIVPILQNREPIARWKISIEDQEGKPVMGGGGDGNIPEKFVWKGQTSVGKAVDEGVFNIVVRAWDLADNESITSEEVTVSRTKPVIEVEARRLEQSNDILVNIQYTGDIPISFWQMEIWSDDNELLQQTVGDTLPTSVKVAFQKEKTPNSIDCVIMVKDILGNQTKQEVKDLLKVVNAGETEEKKPAEKEWNADF